MNRASSGIGRTPGLDGNEPGERASLLWERRVHRCFVSFWQRRTEAVMLVEIDVVARIGPGLIRARRSVRAMSSDHPNEILHVGRLSAGLAPRRVPLLPRDR